MHEIPAPSCATVDTSPRTMRNNLLSDRSLKFTALERIESGIF